MKQPERPPVVAGRRSPTESRWRRLLESRLGQRLAFFVLAALIGALVGLSTLVLIKLVLLFQWIGYGAASEIRYAQIIAARPAWQVVLVPAAGGLVLGILMQFLPGRRYHGIADVMEACALNSARMPVRSGVGAGLAAAISLGLGAPLGREGPAVHIGASISAWLAERLGLPHKQSLALLGCGAAAAVAVSFNTPIAAVIFALEVIVGYFTLRVFAPIVIATMLAMLVREYFLGQQALFPVLPNAIASNWELILFASLGILGAWVAKAMLALTGGFEQAWKRSGLPRWCQPALAGAMIGIVALPLPHILGIGFEGTLLALRGDLDNGLVAWLLLAKFVVVCLALSSGFAGGIFGPAIFMGSMLGGVFWALASLSGLPLSDQGVYATIGMAAMGSALLGAPISTVLIVFELTHDYGITLGVMTAAAVASTVMQSGEHGSFFRWQLARRNVSLASGRDISLLMTHRVEKLIRTGYLQVHTDITTGELESRMGQERQRIAIFVDEDGVFRGSVNLSLLISHAIDNGMDSPAIDGALDSAYAITSLTNIVTAVQSMAEHKQEYLPVVNRAKPKKPELLGVVTKSDLLAEHYDVIKRAREEEFGIT
ncbi:MAG: chloride channel protein [Granulosicoccus sp.]|nr:chloride channel protein [Granulosicoccus sp.]